MGTGGEKGPALMLKILPNFRYPITLDQFNPLMDNLVQLNILDAGLNDKTQRGIGLYLHTYDLWVKSRGVIDYRGPKGHQRLVEDAMTFCGHGNPVATRHGDLAAAHLAIDWHDTQVRCMQNNMQLLTTDRAALWGEARELCEYSPEMEKRVGLLMDWLGKKPLV